ncbi:hypothetical protein Tco_1204803 [Tanacetum coccineum]
MKVGLSKITKKSVDKENCCSPFHVGTGSLQAGVLNLLRLALNSSSYEEDMRSKMRRLSLQLRRDWKSCSVFNLSAQLIGPGGKC